MRVLAFALLAVSLLAGCDAKKNAQQSSDAVVRSVAYQHDGPSELVLMTTLTIGGSGAHTALMINGSQRVIFDPAGTFRDSKITNKYDVVYGVTPAIERAYLGFHARETHYVVIQRKQVSPAVAEQALRTVLNYGEIPSAACTSSTSKLLQTLPGFETIKSVLFPNRLMDQFGSLPGVVTTEFRENDDSDRFKALEAMQVN